MWETSELDAWLRSADAAAVFGADDEGAGAHHNMSNMPPPPMQERRPSPLTVELDAWRRAFHGGAAASSRRETAAPAVAAHHMHNLQPPRPMPPSPPRHGLSSPSASPVELDAWLRRPEASVVFKSDGGGEELLRPPTMSPLSMSPPPRQDVMQVTGHPQFDTSCVSASRYTSPKQDIVTGHPPFDTSCVLASRYTSPKQDILQVTGHSHEVGPAGHALEGSALDISPVPLDDGWEQMVGGDFWAPRRQRPPELRRRVSQGGGGGIDMNTMRLDREFDPAPYHDATPFLEVAAPPRVDPSQAAAFLVAAMERSEISQRHGAHPKLAWLRGRTHRSRSMLLGALGGGDTFGRDGRGHPTLRRWASSSGVEMASGGTAHRLHAEQRYTRRRSAELPAPYHRQTSTYGGQSRRGSSSSQRHYVDAAVRAELRRLAHEQIREMGL
ncbi:hypothetical protein ACHAXT_006047 [Thalassiosira profunda]